MTAKAGRKASGKNDADARAGKAREPKVPASSLAPRGSVMPNIERAFVAAMVFFATWPLIGLLLVYLRCCA